MPLYDYRCAEGHTFESRQDLDVALLTCPQCETPARRIVTSAPGVVGFTARPTREAPVRLSQFVEAHSEIVTQAERHGVKPPDLFRAAQERVRRGDVQAIE